MDTLEYMAESVASAWGEPFRGEIWEYARKLDLQNGYAVKGAFDIETARHLIMPLRAIREPSVLIISVQSAVQTLKSLIADLCVPFWVETDPGDTLWLFEDEPKAKLYAETRVMPLLTSVPEIKAFLEDVNRHDKTKTGIKFRHMNLMLAGLNLGNVQSISWRRIIVDELWMHKSDGLVRQAKDRTKQYPDTKKVVLLGQGGVEDDDADREHRQTDRYELHYQCPHCGEYQPFKLDEERPESFPIEALRGKRAGLAWEISDSTRPRGRWNYQELYKTAHHRCWFCDFRIEDDPTIRRALNDSYKYFRQGEPARPETELQNWPTAIGFHWTAEASMRIPFGELAVKYVRAKTAAEELGYRLPLQEFHQKDRGVSWSDTLESEFREITHEAYDVHSDWPEEVLRTMIVDCQKDLKRFFYGVFAASATGETRELARGEASSFDDLATVQETWKIADQRVFVDCGYEMTKVLRQCVQRGHKGNIKIAGKIKEVWLCWTGMKGSGIEFWRHRNPRNGLMECKLFSRMDFYNVNIGTKDRYPRAPWFQWSNLHCKDLLRDRRDQDPTAPKFLCLPDTLPASDPWSFFAQMRSEKRVEKWGPRGKYSIWEPINKQTKPNHRWDIGGMLMAVQARVGIIGAPEEAEAV